MVPYKLQAWQYARFMVAIRDWLGDRAIMSRMQ